MYIAVEGCAHGELERIYNVISLAEQKNNFKVDLLICCGDFQTTRNLDDLEAMAIPRKYHDICTFYKYYSGEKIAPMLTIFVGGNHEASNYLQELAYGGWVAPNIYYLGYAGVVNVNGIRIAGISGIYKHHDYLKGHYELPPYDESTKRSVYHTRNLEVFRLKQLSGNIDIFISHDWPRGIYNFANSKQLIRFKPHFREEIESNRLGSPSSEQLLKALQPSYWFAAHMHCKFAACVPHEDSGKVTKFLALDKCLPKRRFLQILEIKDDKNDNKLKFEYDLEWLAILYLTNNLLSIKNSIRYMPSGEMANDRYNFTPTENEKEIIYKKFSNNLEIPENFVKTAEPFDPNNSKISVNLPVSKINPQTTQFCDKLCIDDPLNLSMIINKGEQSFNQSSSINESEEKQSYLFESSDTDQHESSLNSSCYSSITQISLSSPLKLPQPKNQEEINLINEDSESENEDDDSKDELAGEIIKINNFETIVEVIKNENKEESNLPIKKFKRRNQEIYSSTNEN